MKTHWTFIIILLGLGVIFAVGWRLYFRGETDGVSHNYPSILPWGTTFKSFETYRHDINIETAPSNDKGLTVTSAEIEVRFPEEKLRLGCFPYIWDLTGTVDNRPSKFPHLSAEGLGDDVVRRLGKVKPGIYELALYLNGKRASNVVSIRIDPHFDEATRPTLEVIALQPNAGEAHGRLLVYAKGPTPVDEAFTYYGLFTGVWTVDGSMRTYHPPGPFFPLTMEGAEKPVQSGYVHKFIARLEEYYTPHIDLNKSHTMVFHCSKYESAPLLFDPLDKRLNQSWDEQTDAMKDKVQTLPLQLEGRVTDATGNPVTSCEVDARSTLAGHLLDDHLYVECTDQNGWYHFVGLPTGTYAVSCEDRIPDREYEFGGEFVEIRDQAHRLDFVVTGQRNIKKQLN